MGALPSCCRPMAMSDESRTYRRLVARLWATARCSATGLACQHLEEGPFRTLRALDPPSASFERETNCGMGSSTHALSEAEAIAAEGRDILRGCRATAGAMRQLHALRVPDRGRWSPTCTQETRGSAQGHYRSVHEGRRRWTTRREERVAEERARRWGVGVSSLELKKASK